MELVSSFVLASFLAGSFYVVVMCFLTASGLHLIIKKGSQEAFSVMGQDRKYFRLWGPSWSLLQLLTFASVAQKQP